MDENSTSGTFLLGNIVTDYVYDYDNNVYFYDNCTGDYMLEKCISANVCGGRFTILCNYCSFQTIEICEPDNSQELTIMAVQVTVLLITFTLGVIGNSLVIVTFTKNWRLRLRCMTDVFLFYLAVSDLLLLLTLPLQTSEIIIGSWMFGNVMCKFNYGLCAINTYGGLLLLACISVDRYMLVVRARTAQALRPSMLCYSKLSAIAVAFTSIVLSLPELLSTSVNRSTTRCEYVGNEGDNGRVKMWARVAKVTGSCVPCIAMLVCYSTIGHVLMQGRGKCFCRQKTLRLIVALIVLFLLFQMPYAIVHSIRLFISEYSCQLWTDIHLAEHVTRSLAYVRCCLNPLLYVRVRVRFGNDVMKLLYDCTCISSRVSHMTPHQDHESSVSPSCPPPTISLMPFSGVNSPKVVPGTASPVGTENPVGIPQPGVKESNSP